MADVHCRFALRYVVELGINFRLRQWVKRSSRLVQHNERCVFVQRACNGYLLRLTAGNVHAIFVVSGIQEGVQPLFHCCQPVAETCFVEAFRCTSGVVICRRTDIFAQSKGKNFEVLKHHREKFKILAVSVFSYVHAVK